jgi:hypothetical protein
MTMMWLMLLLGNYSNNLKIEKENHGRKFKMVDSCLDVPTNIFITLYKTNKVLVQAKKQSANIHFIDEHLEDLFLQVYKKKNGAMPMMGLTKPNKKVKDSPLVRNLRKSKKVFQLPCKNKECNFLGTSVSGMKEHRKSQHPVHKPPKATQLTSTICESSDVATRDGTTSRSVIPDLENVSIVLQHITHFCMLCGIGFVTENELRRHEREVHEVSCTECNEVFFTTYDLKMHSLTHIESN